MVLEVYIRRRGVEWLRSQGCDVIKHGQEGWPDDLVIYAPGRHYWIEWKQPDGSLTAAQKKRIPLMRARGHEVFVLDNTDENKAVLRTKRGETR